MSYTITIALPDGHSPGDAQAIADGLTAVLEQKHGFLTAPQVVATTDLSVLTAQEKRVIHRSLDLSVIALQGVATANGTESSTLAELRDYFSAYDE